MTESRWSIVKLFLILSLTIISIGCTHHYVPQQYPVKPGMAPDFSGVENIHVINAQETSNVVLLASQGAHKHMGDLQLWTDTAVGLLRSELEKRGISTPDTATKQIKLKIVDAKAYFGFSALRCILTLEVETSNGITKTFEGNNKSPWTLYRACDGAVTLAITDLLNDEDMLAFMKY